jgi:hypothetical protein
MLWRRGDRKDMYHRCQKYLGWRWYQRLFERSHDQFIYRDGLRQNQEAPGDSYS